MSLMTTQLTFNLPVSISMSYFTQRHHSKTDYSLNKDICYYEPMACLSWFKMLPDEHNQT